MRTRKTYLRGTHRTVAPNKTLENFAHRAGRLGITRVANVTGLDYLGIPVFMAVRPNARSLSVSQGKGIDEASAHASALMEGAELWHAENAKPSLSPASWTKMQALQRSPDSALLPRIKGARLEPNTEIHWAESVDISSGQRVSIPFDLVHTDFRATPHIDDTPFLKSTNGLASGNHVLEASCAALCEVIERDALACWQYRGPKDKAARRLLLESVSDEACNALLDRLSDHRMETAVWYLSTDIGVPVFLCRLGETSDNDRSRHGDFWGCGCHSTREVALIRAVTEAVQTRLTYIAGSRDDLRRRHYSTRAKSVLDVALNLWELARSETLFDDVPTEHNASFERDLESLLGHLRGAGLTQVLRVDLTNGEFGIPVVRIVVPGLETWTGDGREATGLRVKALRKAST